MKIFAFILTAYFFALCVMPCTHLAHKHIRHDQHTGAMAENNDSDISHCSPFCTCNCCSSHVVQNKAIIQTHDDWVFESFSDLYYGGKLSSRFHSFWQPPKIG